MPRQKAIPESDLPNRVREIRTLRGWTLKELAERSGLFFTQIAKLETGERPAKDFELKALAKALEVATADLIPIAQGGLSDEERQMIATYRDMAPEMKRVLRAPFDSAQDQRAGKGVVALPERPAAPGEKKAS